MGRTPNACLYHRNAGQSMPRISYMGKGNFPVEISINMTYSSSVAKYNEKDCSFGMMDMTWPQGSLGYWRIKWRERKRQDR